MPTLFTHGKCFGCISIFSFVSLIVNDTYSRVELSKFNSLLSIYFLYEIFDEKKTCFIISCGSKYLSFHCKNANVHDVTS